jgi:DNA-binding NtrC family response regulator
VLSDAPYLQPHDFPSISGRRRAAAGVRGARAGPPAPRRRERRAPRRPVRILDGRGHLRTLEEIERDLIQLAIEVYAGHMSEVARRLGIGRSTLYRKVREQGLDGLVKGETEGEAEEVAA